MDLIMKWILLLMLLQYVHSRSTIDNSSLNSKHCIKMTPAKELEINTILAKFSEFLNKLADEHENFDIPYINISFESHSDDESEEKDTNLRVTINDCDDINASDKYSKPNAGHENIFTVNKKNLDGNTKTLQALSNNTNIQMIDTSIKAILKIINYTGKAKNEEITGADRIFEIGNKTSQDVSNKTDFDVIDTSIRVKDKIHANDIRAIDDIVLKASKDTAQTENLNEVNKWKARFMNTIEKLLDDTVRNIRIKAERKGDRDETALEIEGTTTNFTENTQLNVNYLHSDENPAFTENLDNIQQNNRRNVKVYQDIEDNQEYLIINLKRTNLIYHFTENVPADITQVKNCKTTIDTNDGCEYDEKDYSLPVSQRADDFKGQLKIYQSDNESSKTHDIDTKIIENHIELKPPKAIEETILILDTNPVETDSNNVNNFGHNRDFIDESTDTRKHEVLNYDTNNFNDKDQISIHKITVEVGDTFYKNENEQRSDSLLQNNSIREVIHQEVNTTTDLGNISTHLSNNNGDDNSCKDTSEIIKEDSIKKDKIFTVTEDFVVNQDPAHSDLDEISNISEIINPVTKKVPEVLSLSLEEIDDDIFQLIEHKIDSAMPLWVYIQERKDKDEYVFLRK